MLGCGQDDDHIGDPRFLGVDFVAAHPLRASVRTKPLVRREIINDGSHISATRCRSCGVTFIEAVEQLTHRDHHVGFFRRHGLPRLQNEYREGGYDLAHIHFIPIADIFGLAG